MKSCPQTTKQEDIDCLNNISTMDYTKWGRLEYGEARVEWSDVYHGSFVSQVDGMDGTVRNA